jgi:hypothetical protein
VIVAHRRRPAPAPPARSDLPITPGAIVGGFVVQTILRRREGRSALVEAVAPDGTAATLAVFTETAAANASLQARIKRLGSLRDVTDAHLVPVLAAGRSDGRLFVAYARPEGETLAERLQQGPLPPREAVRLLSEIAAGLETLRRADLPYGSLTPHTILLTGKRTSHALLRDYGFAPAAVKACVSSAAIERADYLPPETIRGTPSEPGGVVYALACVLVECLTGHPPFPYDRPLLVMRGHLEEEPPRVSERAPLPEALDAVIRTALTKHPEQRQRSAAALMRAAQRAVGLQLPIKVADPPPADAAPSAEVTPASETATATPRVERAPAPHRRRRRLIPSTAPAGVALSIGILASTAGFAAGSRGGTTDTTTTPKVPTVSAAAAAAMAARSDYVRAMDRVVADLRKRRAAQRDKLRSAMTAAAQSQAATALAEIYRETRAALPRHPSGATGTNALEAQLRAAGGAYRRVAAAARDGQPAAFNIAARDILLHEGRVDRELSRLVARR